MNKSFKTWILREYKTNWHSLSDYTLLIALKEYNKTFNKNLKKFWY